jgi:hypothetical protein
MAFVAAYNLDGSSVDSISSTTGTDTAITYAEANGKVGKGALFNGTSSTIASLRSLSTFSYIQNTGVFGINIWLKRTATGTLNYIMGSTPTSLEKGFFWGFNANNTMVFNIFKGINSTPVVSFNTGIVSTDTNWHMWTVTGDGSVLRFYLDASIVDTSGSMGAFSSGDSTRLLTIGIITSFGSNWYSGSADIAYFYDHTLTQGEMNQLYNGGNGLQFFNSGMFQYFL